MTLFQFSMSTFQYICGYFPPLAVETIQLFQAYFLLSNEQNPCVFRVYTGLYYRYVRIINKPLYWRISIKQQVFHESIRRVFYLGSLGFKPTEPRLCFSFALPASIGILLLQWMFRTGYWRRSCEYKTDSLKVPMLPFVEQT